MTIKELRTKTGMTQKQFSEYLNIPNRTIEDWESERRKPPIYVIELIEDKINGDGFGKAVFGLDNEEQKAHDKLLIEYHIYKSQAKRRRTR